MSLGPEGTSLNPEQAENFEDHMSTYWSILEKMPGSKLRLTKLDDEIYDHFRREFPEFDPAETIDEDKMKSKEGKERWRNFMMQYEKKIDDYNFGTMLRSNPTFEYGEKETIFGAYGPSRLEYVHLEDMVNILIAMRMQFYAIEVSRNRQGLNDWIYERAKSRGGSSKT
ncbi:MAG: hypothetical protein Q9163_002471 [Psora crenata]